MINILLYIYMRVSIRAARAGRDQPRALAKSLSACFYPRGPCGPRRAMGLLPESQQQVSIRAARAGRDS